jgi:hypothetical protein
MSDELVRKILDDAEYDTAREHSLRRFIASAFEARTRAYTWLVAIAIVLATGVAVWMAILFFGTQELRALILYATVFNTCMLTIAAVRLFLWQVLLRQGTFREIKRLELRIVELTKTLQAKEQQSHAQTR